MVKGLSGEVDFGFCILADGDAALLIPGKPQVPGRQSRTCEMKDQLPLGICSTFAKVIIEAWVNLKSRNLNSLC
ncbi:unnamed protein product [Rhodiola kirilowii]